MLTASGGLEQSCRVGDGFSKGSVPVVLAGSGDGSDGLGECYAVKTVR